MSFHPLPSFVFWSRVVDNAPPQARHTPRKSPLSKVSAKYQLQMWFAAAPVLWPAFLPSPPHPSALPSPLPLLSPSPSLLRLQGSSSYCLARMASACALTVGQSPHRASNFELVRQPAFPGNLSHAALNPVLEGEFAAADIKGPLYIYDSMANTITRRCPAPATASSDEPWLQCLYSTCRGARALRRNDLLTTPPHPNTTRQPTTHACCTTSAPLPCTWWICGCVLGPLTCGVS